MATTIINIFALACCVTVSATAAEAENMTGLAPEREEYIANLTSQSKQSDKESSREVESIENLLKKADEAEFSGDHGRASQIWMQMASIFSQEAGDDSKKYYIFSLTKAGELLIRSGNPDKGARLLEKAYEQAKEQEDFSESHMMSILNALSVAYNALGDITSAQKTLENAILQSKQTNIPPSILLNLSESLERQSKYSEAESLLAKALAATSEAHGEKSRESAKIEVRLGDVYRKQGKLDLADKSLVSALDTLSAVAKANKNDESRVDLAEGCNSLGHIFLDRGLNEKAASWFLNSVRLTQGIGGRAKSLHLTSLQNLAVAYRLAGKAQQAKAAETELIRADPDRAQKNPSHINNRALELAARGNLVDGIALLKTAIAIAEERSDTVLLADLYTNVSGLSSENGDHREASKYLQKSLELQQRILTRESLLVGSSYTRDFVTSQGWDWMVAIGQIDWDPAYEPVALWSTINRKGIIREVDRIRNQALLKAPHSEQKQKLLDIRRILERPGIPPNQRDSLEKHQATLEKDLLNDMAPPSIGAVSIRQIAQALPEDSVLIEYQWRQPIKKDMPNGPHWPDPEIWAFVLKKDETHQAIRLGLKSDIEEKILKALASTEENLQDSSQRWQEVYDILIRPLSIHTMGISRIFVSPDGEISRVPLSALHLLKKSNKQQDKNQEFHIVTSSKDLLKLQRSSSSEEAAGVEIFANPDFGPRTNARSADPDGTTTTRSLVPETTEWEPLYASELEGRTLATLLNGTLWTGAEASATRLRNINNPRILHIATHGYFLGARSEVSSRNNKPMKGVSRIRSGIVLAGANTPNKGSGDSGYLTAIDISLLNLTGTELVVLSACSTAQGELKVGEGLYGLQRSLALAGARSTLLSLWKVDDDATEEFMTRFYTRLKSGAPRSEALIATQKDFRVGIAGKGQWTDPYYWAAWQLVGDWRPIKGL